MAGAAGGSRDELAAYLALAQVPGIGAARLRTRTAGVRGAAEMLVSLQAIAPAIDRLAGFLGRCDSHSQCLETRPCA